MRKGMIAAALFMGAAVPALAQSGEYALEVPLAAVSPAGEFPVHIETNSIVADGTVRLTLDASGRVQGSIEFPGLSADLSGKFATRGGRATLKLRAPGRRGMRLTGRLSGSKTFTGSFADGGTLTSGHGRFTIDAATAQPLTASVEAAVRGGFGRARRGVGSAISGGANVALTADVIAGDAPEIRLRGGSFQFVGKGTFVGTDFTLQSWKARGFGASATGLLLAVAHTPLADVTMLGVNGHPLEGGSVDLAAGALPALALKLRLAGFDVTTTAFSGVAGTDENSAYGALLSALRDVESARAARRYPTRVVIIGLGQGSVRAHGAINAIPELPVDVLIDLDATSAGWEAQDNDPDPLAGNPVGGGTTVFEVPFDLEDVIPGNVVSALEVVSASTVPVALAGVPDLPFDDRWNRRPEGFVDDLYRHDTTTTHEEIHSASGTTMRSVAAWLTDLLRPVAKR